MDTFEKEFANDKNSRYSFSRQIFSTVFLKSYLLITFFDYLNDNNEQLLKICELISKV